jgi:hypothetical protein
MPIQRTQGTVRASKGYAIFRIIFGFFFIGLGFSQYSRDPSGQLPLFTFGIGGLFIAYGLWAFFAKRSLGNRIELETEVPSVGDRLAEITRLKSSGLITEQEYESKRQEILKNI